MNLTALCLKRLLPLALVLLAGSAITARSQESKKPLSRDELVAAARAIMTAARYCALITLDSSGRPQA